MATSYECKNCSSFNTKWLKDMIRHIKNKKKCEKTLFSMEYSKDQILILSFIANEYYFT